MSYADWMKLFDEFRNTNTDKDKLAHLLSLEDNPNYHAALLEHFHELIHDRLQLSIDKIIADLETIFDDYNYMDFTLVSFKKEVDYLVKMLDCKVVDDVARVKIKLEIKDGVDTIYEIMNKKALEFDYTGVLSSMINSNKIKWS